MRRREKLFNQMKHDFIKVLQIIKSCVNVNQMLVASRVKYFYFKKYKDTEVADEARTRYNILYDYWGEKWNEIMG